MGLGFLDYYDSRLCQDGLLGGGVEVFFEMCESRF